MKLKQISIIIGFFILLSNCAEQQPIKQDKSKMIVYLYDSNSQDYTDTIDVSITAIDSTHYLYKRKDIKKKDWARELKIDLNRLVVSSVAKENNWKDTNIIVDRKWIKLPYNGNKYFFVYKILVFAYAADSQGLIFWTPEYGIILERSLTWRTLVRYEFLENDARNEIIRHLGYLVLRDKEFFNLDDWGKYIEY